LRFDEAEKEILTLFSKAQEKGEKVELRFTEIKENLSDTRVFLNVDNKSVPVILSRKLKKLVENGVLAKDDRGHRKVFYSLADETAIQLAHNLKRESEVQSRYRESEKPLKDFIHFWTTHSEIFLNTVLESEFTFAYVNIKDPYKKGDKTILMLSLPSDKISNNFRNRKNEDFYYLPYASFNIIQNWNEKNDEWTVFKEKLRTNPDIRESVSNFLKENLESTKYSEEALIDLDIFAA